MTSAFYDTSYQEACVLVGPITGDVNFDHMSKVVSARLVTIKLVSIKFH